MLLNNIPPHPSLKEVVRFYRIIHFDFADNKNVPAKKAYRPRIEHCLQFTPFDAESVQYNDRSSGITHKVALFGQHTVLNQRSVGRYYLNFQIVFQPGFLAKLLKMPIVELTNLYVDASDYLGNDVKMINEHLAYAKDHAEMIIIVEAYLLRLASRGKADKHPCDRIAINMLDPFNQRSVNWYANQSNLCYRQFERMFKIRNGITPKEYTSLVRLDLAYLLKNRYPKKDWFWIAIESGFYDYQHLSKEYIKYTSYTPSAFFDLEQKAPERYFGDFEQ